MKQSSVIYAVCNDEACGAVLSELLNMYGLSCQIFTEAAAALESFASARPRPAILITGCLDGVSGLRLIQRCKEIEPSLKVILWSGHREADLASMLAEVPVVLDAKVPKPHDNKEMIAKVHELLTEVTFAPSHPSHSR